MAASRAHTAAEPNNSLLKNLIKLHQIAHTHGNQSPERALKTWDKNAAQRNHLAMLNLLVNKTSCTKTAMRQSNRDNPNTRENWNESPSDFCRIPGL